MENAKSFMQSTDLAARGLFELLDKYHTHKVEAFVVIFNSKDANALATHRQHYTSVDIAREVISGSILQIAYAAINDYSKPSEKSEGAIYFESEINRLIDEASNPRIIKFNLPNKFCVGRELGDLPIGMVIYAARNQYNHASAARLKVENEIVFNYLHSANPSPPNGLSFNLYDENNYYSYSCLVALEWHGADGHEKYKADISSILDIEL